MANDDRHIRPFAEFLPSVRKGQLAEELAIQLADLLLAIDETQKSGSITLTLSCKPIGKGSGAIEITDKVVVKAPEGDKPATVVFADASGNPVRNDPRQPELSGLREVPAPEAATDESIREAK